MSEFHKSARWQAFSRKMRALITPLLPLPCVECGRPVLPGQAWDVSHIVDYHIDPFQPLVPEAVGPGHRSCNRKSGAKAGRKKQLQAKARDERLPEPGSGWL